MTVFVCPLCGKKLVGQDKSLVCETGHCFDVAKSGYVNLLPVGGKNSLQPGDNKEMIAARKRVMAKGYYAPLAAKIVVLLQEIGAKKVLDAGCGTGYIPSEVQRALPEGTVVGTDISKFAVEAAAKQNKQVQFAVASSMRLPLEEGYFDAVLCAFAPVYAGEFARVTKDNGYLLRVVPAEEHLYKLKEFLYKGRRPVGLIVRRVRTPCRPYGQRHFYGGQRGYCVLGQDDALLLPHVRGETEKTGQRRYADRQHVL